MTELPQLPRIRLSQLERLRGQLAAAMSPWRSRPVAATELTEAICGCLAGNVADAVFESVRSFGGQPLSSQQFNSLVWRIAGNTARLQAGYPVQGWVAQSCDEWVPFYVRRLSWRLSPRRQPGYDVRLFALAGSVAGTDVEAFWTNGAAYYVAARVGFSGYRGDFRFRSPPDLVGLRLFGLVSQSRSRERPAISEIAATSSMQKWNRDHVLRLRLRVGQRCPLGFEHRCAACAVGYDQCAAATHPATYETGYCAGCDDEEALFDPEDTSELCVRCALRARSGL